MTVQVGTDLVRVSRLENRGAGFLKRTFTTAEIELCAGRTQSLAGRWAAKEAVMKALGVGIGELPMTDIEVGSEDSGRPVLSLRGMAHDLAEQAGIVSWSVSIAHDGDYATATVIGSGR